MLAFENRPDPPAGSIARAVIVGIIGGLGNQMFQYAAGFSLAKDRDAPLVCDLRWYDGQLKRRFELDHLNVDVHRGGRAQLGALRPHKAGRDRLDVLYPLLGKPRPQRIAWYTQPGFHFDGGIGALECPVYLEGYFQSWRYFERHDDEIRAMFAPAAPLSSPTRVYAAQIQRAPRPTALHIRRGDYASEAHTLAFHGVLPESYYRRGLDILRSMLGAPPDLFVFSDDLPFAREMLREHADAVFVDGNFERPWEDMHLMSLCRHFVLANSSFSWWGGWLSRAADKIVIAPRAWFQPAVMRTRNTADLIPDDWITV